MVAIRRLTLLVSLCSLTFGQKVTFEAVPPAIIEGRLRLAPKKQADREPTLEELFRQVGCSDSLTTQPVKGQKSPNLVCVLPGKGPGEIIIGAHFDLRNSQGVVDNWSGAALLASLYQSLKNKQLNHNLVFVGFTAEEQGLLGSEAYVKKNSLENTRAMVNLDTLALSDTKVEVSGSDPALMNLLDAIARGMNLPIAGVNVSKVGRTDAQSFRQKKIPTLSIHTLTQETLPILHNYRDSFEAVHMDAYYRTYRLMAAFLAYLDLKLD